MIRLDENADAARALIQTARFAGARANLRKATHLNLLLQRRADFLRPATGTRAFWVIICAAIRTDKKIALPQRHFVRSAMCSPSNAAQSDYFE
jgi:hypothetical protein